MIANWKDMMQKQGDEMKNITEEFKDFFEENQNLTINQLQKFVEQKKESTSNVRVEKMLGNRLDALKQEAQKENQSVAGLKQSMTKNVQNLEKFAEESDNQELVNEIAKLRNIRGKGWTEQTLASEETKNILSNIQNNFTDLPNNISNNLTKNLEKSQGLLVGDDLKDRLDELSSQFHDDLNILDQSITQGNDLFKEGFSKLSGVFAESFAPIKDLWDTGVGAITGLYSAFSGTATMIKSIPAAFRLLSSGNKKQNDVLTNMSESQKEMVNLEEERVNREQRQKGNKKGEEGGGLFGFEFGPLEAAGLTAAVVMAPFIGMAGFFEGLKLQWERLKFPTIKKIFQPMINLFKRIRDFFDFSGLQVVDDVTAQSGKISKFFGKIKSGFGKIWKSITNIGGYLDDLARSGGRFGKMFGLISSKIFGLFKLVGEWIWPITAIIGAVKGIWDGFKSAKKHFEEGGSLLGSIFIGIWDGLKSAVTLIVDFIVVGIMDLGKWIVSKIAGLFGLDKLSKWLDSFSLSDMFKEGLGAIFDGIKNLFSDGLSGVLPKLGSLIYDIGGWIVYLIKGAVGDIVGWFGKFIPSWDEIKAKIGNLGTRIKNSFLALGDKIKDFFADLLPSWDEIKAKIGNLGTRIKNSFLALGNKIKGFFANLLPSWEEIKAKIGNLGTRIKNSFLALGDKIKGFFAGFLPSWEEIKAGIEKSGGLSGILKTIFVDPIMNLVDKVKGFFANLLPSWEEIKAGIEKSGGLSGVFKSILIDPIIGLVDKVMGFFANLLPSWDQIKNALKGTIPDSVPDFLLPDFLEKDSGKGEKKSKQESEKSGKRPKQTRNIDTLEKSGYFEDDWGKNTLNVEKVRSAVDSGDITTEELKTIKKEANLDSEGAKQIDKLIKTASKNKKSSALGIKQSELNTDSRQSKQINTSDKKVDEAVSKAETLKTEKEKEKNKETVKEITKATTKQPQPAAQPAAEKQQKQRGNVSVSHQPPDEIESMSLLMFNKSWGIT